jgi:hypothetical protein
MILNHDSINLISTYLYSKDSMVIDLMIKTFSTPFGNVFWIGTFPTLPQTPQLKTSITFLNTTENSNSRKQRGSQNPAVRTITSCNQPETIINTAKETKTNAMETIATMKSPFVPTISSVDIHMPNVVTLIIPKEQMPTTPIAMIRTVTATTTTNKIATTKTTETIKTTSTLATII